MSWPFVDIADPFSARGLGPPELNVLTPDPGGYEVLAIQPAGPIVFEKDFIGHQDRALAGRKFDKFIDLSIEKNADLVLSPEYSCPWDCLERAFMAGKLPALKKLWILACESIKPSELFELTRRLPDITWIYEDPPTSSHTFLDVVCYVLKTETSHEKYKDVALLQFKTVPMGGKSTFERDNLILGSKRYFLRNRDFDYIRLVTLLCSEALSLQLDKDATLQFQKHPTIILHPQLVDDTRHEDMRRYRTDLYTNVCSNNLEVFSLNWAREFQDGAQTATVRGNSCFFMKSDQFVRTDDRLQKNHLLGVYYSNWRKHRTELCNFNFDEYVFHFETYRPALLGAAVQLRRTGPEMRSTWQWSRELGAWKQCDRADDGFEDLCDAYGDPSLKLCTGMDFSAVDVERLIALSAGKIELVSDWYDVDKIPSFEAEADERTKRLTFVHEQHGDSQEFRKSCLTRYVKLVSKILLEPKNFPECIRDLAGDFRIVPPARQNGFRLNLSSASEKSAGATAIYLGSQPDGDAISFYDGLRRAWGEDGNNFREERIRRMVVWYDHPSRGIQSAHPSLPKITDDSEIPGSIARGPDK